MHWEFDFTILGRNNTPDPAIESIFGHSYHHIRRHSIDEKFLCS